LIWNGKLFSVSCSGHSKSVCASNYSAGIGCLWTLFCVCWWCICTL